MKKNLKLLGLILSISLGVTGCSGTNPSSDTSDGGSAETPDKQTIVIGTSTISRDVLEVAQKEFNDNNDDYVIEIKLFDDAVTPNIAVQDGSIDATFHQYKSYMDNFNADKNADLKVYGKEIFAFQIGLYSNKITSLDEIQNNMTVAFANDVSNRAIALKLLADQGILTLKPDVTEPSILDITDNPYNLQFVEVERLGLINALNDTDMAVIMSDVVREGGLDASTALAYAQEEGIQLVIKEEQPWTVKVEEALTSDVVKDYIDNETQKTKVSLF